MILVMGALMLNKAIYTHVHFLPCGSLETHAHPFSKSTEGPSGSSHQHSGTELFLLDHLDILILAMCAALVLRQIARDSRFEEPASGLLLTAFIPRTPGRAPPVCM